MAWKQGQLTDVQKRLADHDAWLLKDRKAQSFKEDYEWFSRNRSKLQESFTADLARAQAEGVRPSQFLGIPTDLLREAAGVFDYPLVFGHTVSAAVISGFLEAATEDWRRIAFVDSIDKLDFAIDRIFTGTSAPLQKVKSITSVRPTGSADYRYQVTVDTWAGGEAFDRKTLVNDDLGALTDRLTKLGQACQLTLAQRVFAQLILNGNTYDGAAMFLAAGGKANLLAGALGGGVRITEANMLVAASQWLRARMTPDNRWPAGIGQPGSASLVVPVPLGDIARALSQDDQVSNAGLTAMQNNPAKGLFQVLEVPMLGLNMGCGGSATNWWVLENPAKIRGLVVTFLNGVQAPVVLSRTTGSAMEAPFPAAGGASWQERDYIAQFDFGVGQALWQGAYQGNV
jgi:hypothetical protein